MQNNSIFSGGAIARTILPITLICALGAASARGQATNVTWNRQALGQTVGGSCGPATNLTYWSLTYPNDNNWSQSLVYGSTACGTEVVQPSNWSIPQYPNSTNYNVMIGGDVNLDVNVIVNSVTISLGGELDIPNPSVLRAAVVDVDGGAITGRFTNTTLTTFTSTNASLFTGNNTALVNAAVVQQIGSGGVVLGGYFQTVPIINLASGIYQIEGNSGMVNSTVGASAALFQNQGLVWKSGGTGDSIIAIPFNNLGGSIQVDSGTLTLSGVSGVGSSSNGTFIVAGGATLDLTGGYGPSWAGTLSGSGAGQVSLSNGVINASPGMILNFPSNVFQWSGGALNGPVTNTNTVNIVSTNASTYESPLFVNLGLVRQIGAGGLILGGYFESPVFNNLAGGTYKFVTDSGIANSLAGASTPLFQNQGLVWKSGGVNVSLVSIPFNNLGGSIQVDSGTLSLSGGGSSSNGTFIVAGGATLDLTGGSGPNWTGTLSGSGAGQVSLSNGVINASPSMILNFPSNVFQWSGGALNGPVTNVNMVNIVSANASTYESSVSGNYSMFVNQGLVEQTGAGGLILGGYFESSVFNNVAGGTYRFVTDSGIANSLAGASTPLFQNEGLVWKSGGISVSLVSIPFNNLGGSIQVDSGTLSLSGGGSSSNGTFIVASGATLDLTGGSGPDWTGTLSGSGAGQVLLGSGTLNASPGMSLNFPSNVFQWSGGALNGFVTNLGIVNISSANASAYESSVSGSYSMFVNQGLVQQIGAGGLILGGYFESSVFNNVAGGTYKFLTDSGIANSQAGASTPLFQNQGLVWKSAGTNTTTLGIAFDNLGGTIQVDSGMLSLSGGGSSSNGTVTVARGAALDLTGGSGPNWAGTLSGSGAGQVWLGSGSLNAGPALILNFPSNVFQWSGGALNGVVTNLGVVNVSGTNNSTLTGGNTVFVNQGTVQQTGSAALVIGGYFQSTLFSNAIGGTYKFLTDSGIANSPAGASTPLFQNQGLVWKSAGTNTTSIGIAFDNLGGSNEVDSGTLSLSGGGSSSNGTFIVAGGAALDLTGGNSPTWAGTLSGSGAGQVWLGSGSLNASPAMILNFPPNVLQWSGGVLYGVVTNLGVVNVSGTNNSTLTGGDTVFVNQGTVQQTGSAALVIGGYFQSTLFSNAIGGTYKFLTDSGIANSVAGASTPSFKNLGLVWKSGGTNTSAISLPFVNQGGAIRVDSGTLSLNGGSYVQGGGALTISLGGPNAGQFGQLSAGSASLGGPLNVIMTNGFAGTVGSRFQILACSSLSGAFTSINATTNISVSYSTNGVFLTVTNVAVIAPVQITSAQLSGNNFKFGFQTANNQSYTVQQNTNLAGTNWLLYTNFIGNGSAVQLAVPVSAAPQQFFRIREP